MYQTSLNTAYKLVTLMNKTKFNDAWNTSTVVWEHIRALEEESFLTKQRTGDGKKVSIGVTGGEHYVELVLRKVIPDSD